MTDSAKTGVLDQLAALGKQNGATIGRILANGNLGVAEDGPDGKMQPARDVLDRRKSNKTEVYSVDHLHGMLPLFSDHFWPPPSATGPRRGERIQPVDIGARMRAMWR